MDLEAAFGLDNVDSSEIEESFMRKSCLNSTVTYITRFAQLKQR